MEQSTSTLVLGDVEVFIAGGYPELEGIHSYAAFENGKRILTYFRIVDLLSENGKLISRNSPGIRVWNG